MGLRFAGILCLGTAVFMTVLRQGVRTYGSEFERKGNMVSTELDKPQVHQGGDVRLTEYVPEALDVWVREVGHRVVRVGNWDASRGVFERSIAESRVNPGDVFEGLPEVELGCPGLAFDFAAGNRKGYVFKFRPREPGVYRLLPVWHLKGGGRLEEEPVILVVGPPAANATPAKPIPPWPPLAPTE